MVTQAWDVNHEAHAALVVVVKEKGITALSDPQLMLSMLRDLIPGLPKESNILVHAAEEDVAGMLRDRLAQHISTGAAVTQAAVLLEERTALAPDGCQWAVRLMAQMIGLPVAADEARRYQNTQTWPPREEIRPAPQPVPQPAPQPSPQPVPQPAPRLSPQPTPQPAPQPSPQPAPWLSPQPTPQPSPQPAPQPSLPPVPRPSPSARSGPALVAGWAALACALSVPLQLLINGSLTGSYSLELALFGLILFTAAMLTLRGKSRNLGVGLAFGAALVVVPNFVEGSVTPGLGGGFVVGSVITTVIAVIVAVSSILYFGSSIRAGNLRNPLAVAYSLASLGFIAATIPGRYQFNDGSGWFTVTGVLGSGVDGRFLFAGIVAVVALLPVAVLPGLLPARSGIRAGVIAGSLAAAVAYLVGDTLYAAEIGVRAAPGLYASWALWAIALALGVALLATDRSRPRVTAQPVLTG